MSFGSFLASFRPKVAAQMAKQRQAQRAAVANPNATRAGDPEESTFFGAIMHGKKKVAAAIAPQPKEGTDYRAGYDDAAAAPVSRGPWARAPGAQYPTSIPVLSRSTGEIVSPPVYVPPSATAQQAVARQQAELASFARAIPVPGLAPVIAVGEAVASLVGISPTFVWPDNFDPYTGDGTPFHGGMDIWNNPAPQGKPFGASGIIALPGETLRNAALRNQLTFWQQTGHPLTPTQQKWLDENSGEKAAPDTALVVRTPFAPVVVAIPEAPKAAAPSNPYGLTDEQVANIRGTVARGLFVDMFRNKYPLLFS
jgi:hypothetical protein